VSLKQAAIRSAGAPSVTKSEKRRASHPMTPIDDPFDQLKKQYPEEQKNPGVDAALMASKALFPALAPLLGVLGQVRERFTKTATMERIADMLDLLENEVKRLDSRQVTKVDLEDLKESMQLAIRYDAEDFNDRKRERYVRIIGNATASEQQISDLASFIRDIEQMGERDFTALKVLNKVMNPPRLWTTSPNTPDAPPVRALHPNIFIHLRQSLAIQMAEAFGIKTEIKTEVDLEAGPFSREEGYEACARLQGFGLAHEIDVGHREVPIGNYCFRPSKRGLLLLKLVGEDVPNWERYFPSR
jgi:hypothetical protein